MWHHNVELLAYHDLDGRSRFKLALQEVAMRFFLYVAGLAFGVRAIMAAASIGNSAQGRVFARNGGDVVTELFRRTLLARYRRDVLS